MKTTGRRNRGLWVSLNLTFAGSIAQLGRMTTETVANRTAWAFALLGGFRYVNARMRATPIL